MNILECELFHYVELSWISSEGWMTSGISSPLLSSSYINFGPKGTKWPCRGEKSPFESKQMHNWENKEEVGIRGMRAFRECQSRRTKGPSDVHHEFPSMGHQTGQPRKEYQLVTQAIFSQAKGPCLWMHPFGRPLTAWVLWGKTSQHSLVAFVYEHNQDQMAGQSVEY